MNSCRFSSAVLLLLTILFGFSTAYSTESRQVALVMKDLSNPFFIKLDQGARDYATRNNIPLKVFGLDRETDVEHQISIMESLIAQNTGAIVIAPADSRKLIPVCVKAIKQGITVINIDNPLDQKDLKDRNISIPFIGPDNLEGGELIGNYIREKLEGRGRILIIEGIPGAFNSEARKKGFLRGLELAPDIEIIKILSANWHSEEAFTSVIELLKIDQQIDAILCANDVMAQGVLQALDVNSLPEKIYVTGYDNIAPIQEEIRNNRIQATIEQYPDIMGAEGVKAAWKAITTGKPAEGRNTLVNLITKDSMGKKIIVSISTLANPFFATMIDNVKKEATLHDIEVKVIDAGNDDAKQIVDIIESLEESPDLLIINSTNSATIVPALDQAMAAGVPVISVDRYLDTNKVLTNITSDNYQGGQLAADFIVEELGKKGNLLELEGIPGTTAAHDRGAGFNERVQSACDIKVVSREVGWFDSERAQSVVKHLLQEGMKVDGVFAHNDSMALGCINAFIEMGVTLPGVIVGFDGIDAAIKAIRDESLTATIAQKPDLMGRLSVITAASYFRGEVIGNQIPVALELIKD